MTLCLYYIQEFIFSLSRVFHVATTSLRAIRTHERASVDRNTLQRLVNLHLGDFVAMLRREWLPGNGLQAIVTEVQNCEKINIEIHFSYRAIYSHRTILKILTL